MTKCLLFRGKDLQKFILVQISSFSEPVQCSELVTHLQERTNVSERTIYQILKILLDDGKIQKIVDLQQGSRTVLYYHNN